jgi:hypothetical protein
MALPTIETCSLYGPVFNAIDKRLQERYRIKIKEHLGEMLVPDASGTIDPSLGGQIKGLGGPRETTIPGKRAKFIEGKTNLIGITFPIRNFQALLDAFREAINKKGEPAFHYHPLKAMPAGGGKIDAFLDKAEQALSLNWLSLSYDQTTVGLSKATEERAWGFREIADSYNIEVGPLEAAGRGTYSGEARHSRRFGQQTAGYARKVDISSLHVAVTPAACNIHIDNMGFVLRGPKNAIGLDADFVQHIVNELLFKTFLRDWLKGKYGESSKGVWAVDHIGLMIPNSDLGFTPMVGASLDAGPVQLTAAFTMDCKCLQGHPLTLEERIVPIPDGWSIGGGIKVEF